MNRKNEIKIINPIKVNGQIGKYGLGYTGIDKREKTSNNLYDYFVKNK